MPNYNWQKTYHPPPQVLLNLTETCEIEDFQLSKLSKIIIRDPSISSKVFSLVNSAYFGQNNTFTNLDQAVVALGAETIKNISLTASIQQVFSKSSKNTQLSINRFWWKSFSVATYAKKIANQTSYSNVEEVYLAGLLLNLGELLLLTNFPEEYATVEAVAKNQKDQCKAEEEQIGINHCEAGAWLVRHWKLNSFIVDALLCHHAPTRQVKSAFPLVKIVHLAEKCYHAKGGTSESLSGAAYELLGLETEQVDTILSDTDDEVQAVAKNLGIPVTLSPVEADEKGLEPDVHDLTLMKQVKNYSLINCFLENLLQANSRDEIFKAIEQAFSILLEIETIFFFLHDFEYKVLYGCSSISNPYSNRLKDLILSSENETNLLVKSMFEKQTITNLRNSGKQLDSLADSQLLDTVGGKGIRYIPMTARNKPVGVIVIGLPDSSADDLTGQSTVNLLKLLADQAAMSLYLDEVKRKQAQRIQTSGTEVVSMEVAKIVHEVNNPLGIIRNYLKILEKKLTDNDSSTKELAILDDEINRITTIIQQLDRFSNPPEHSLEQIDINAMITDLLLILSKSVFYSSNLQVHFKPDPDLTSIRSNEGAIKQIIINLVKNAAEAMIDGGNVYIRTSYVDKDHSNGIKLSIEDDGPGLPKVVLSDIFEPFTSTKGKGHSGLGLSIVHSLVKELQGSITCTSSKSEGTLFTILLPLKQKSVTR